MDSIQDTKLLTMLMLPHLDLPHLPNPVWPLLPTSSLWTLSPSPEHQGVSLDFLLPLPFLDTHKQLGVSRLEAQTKLSFSSGLVEASTEVPRPVFTAVVETEVGTAEAEALPCRTPEPA